MERPVLLCLKKFKNGKLLIAIPSNKKYRQDLPYEYYITLLGWCWQGFYACWRAL